GRQGRGRCAASPLSARAWTAPPGGTVLPWWTGRTRSCCAAGPKGSAARARSCSARRTPARSRRPGPTRTARSTTPTARSPGPGCGCWTSTVTAPMSSPPPPRRPIRRGTGPAPGRSGSSAPPGEPPPPRSPRRTSDPRSGAAAWPPADPGRRSPGHRFPDGGLGPALTPSGAVPGPAHGSLGSGRESTASPGRPASGNGSGPEPGGLNPTKRARGRGPGAAQVDAGPGRSGRAEHRGDRGEEGGVVGRPVRGRDHGQGPAVVGAVGVGAVAEQLAAVAPQPAAAGGVEPLQPQPVVEAHAHRLGAAHLGECVRGDELGGEQGVQEDREVPGTGDHLARGPVQ